MKKYFFIFLGFVLSLNSMVSYSQSTIRTSIENFKIKNNIPAIVVLITSPNDHFSFSSGVTLLNGKIPATTDTLFGVGSITKTFISALILKLEASNKLNINDTIGSYFPQYPRWKSVTIKQLLNMTSGISNCTENPKWKKSMNNYFKHTWGSDELVKISYAEKDYFKPGKGWHYSNTGYILLGKIIENITKKSLTEVLSTELFIPLSLKHTFYEIACPLYKNDDFFNLK